jgi:ribose 5-phosphate isomerase A
MHTKVGPAFNCTIFGRFLIHSIYDHRNLTMQDKWTEDSRRNWIPAPFWQAAQKIAADSVKCFLTEDVGVIGLGSGPMAAAIIREISKLPYKESLQCIATSTQIKLEAEYSRLKIVDENFVTEVEVVFDGADQVDKNRNMIKGGGGALLKEKILHAVSKKVIITAESTKYVEWFNRTVPIEVHPFARNIVKKKLEELSGYPRLRMLDEGYVYVTENGNFILDTLFTSIPDIRKKEVELKSIPGVLEVGLFTRHADIYYKAGDDGSFEKIH